MPRRPARSTVSILPAQRAFLTALVPASQVERLLVAEPENAEYVELKAGLVEVIAMTEDLVDGHPDAKPREAGAEAKANEADASVIDETVAGALCRVRADGAESEWLEAVMVAVLADGRIRVVVTKGDEDVVADVAPDRGESRRHDLDPLRLERLDHPIPFHSILFRSIPLRGCTLHDLGPLRLERLAGALDCDADVFYARQHGRHGDKLRATVVRDHARQGGFSRARRPPKNHRVQAVIFQRLAQGAGRAE